MQSIEKLPIDYDTWKKMNYDTNYFVVNSPFQLVAQSTIKFYKNRLRQLENTLTDENKIVYKESIERIKQLIK